ncbi:ras GEF [Rhizoclosmatium globosum]|uniref:Ras GEF n=1 Tax=Rhizoclosmatium globosum TaxID=329046 RepID=A0A1Y2CTT9_9FUNG|nr:ras GEF [Rhizoclosmatium globosum]|eukprot:ORY50306.1 ras GEF [Rhizoclosmatium globosum]
MESQLDETFGDTSFTPYKLESQTVANSDETIANAEPAETDTSKDNCIVSKQQITITITFDKIVSAGAFSSLNLEESSKSDILGAAEAHYRLHKQNSAYLKSVGQSRHRNNFTELISAKESFSSFHQLSKPSDADSLGGVPISEETIHEESIDATTSILSRPSECPTPKANSNRLSSAVESFISDSDRVSESSSCTTTSTNILSRISNISVQTTATNCPSLPGSLYNPMKVRASVMSTVSTVSTVSVVSHRTRSTQCDKSIGPFLVSLDIYQKLYEELDESLFLEMGFKCVGLDESDDDVSTFIRGNSIKSGSLNALVANLWANVENQMDQRFLTDFLFTYRYFSNSVDVARLLVLSYLEIGWWTSSTSPFLDSLFAKHSNGGNSNDWTGWLKLRILNVFKKWIDLHADDFTCNKDLMEFATQFLEKAVGKDGKRSPHGTVILNKLKEKMVEFEANKYVAIPQLPSLKPTTRPKTPTTTDSSHSSPTFLAPRRFGPKPQSEVEKSPSWSLRSKFAFKTHSRESSKAADDDNKPSQSSSFSSPFKLHSRASSVQTNDDRNSSDAGVISIADALTDRTPSQPKKRLSDLDPVSLAKQLTLLEHTYFRKIKIDEFYAQSWAKSKKPSSSSRLLTLINWFNRVAYGVATEIVKQSVLKDRVIVLKRLISIADHCVKWNNFNTAFEIVAGLNLGPVSRLAKTWKALPVKYVDMWEKLSKVVSSEGSYRTYRQLISQQQSLDTPGPVLPYLGVNLSDLTFTEDGNPTHVFDEASKEQVINFSKFRMISKLLNGIIKSQTGQFDFEHDEVANRWIRQEWEALSSKSCMKCHSYVNRELLPQHDQLTSNKKQY